MAESRNLILAHRNACDAAPIAAASSSNVSVGTGTKSWTVPGSTKFYTGALITAVKTTDATVWLRGTVTAFDVSSSIVTVNVTSSNGAGSHSTWTLTIDKWTAGAWSTSLPLANLDDPRLWMVARANDDDVASTRFVVDLADSVTLQMLQILGSNLEADAAWRIVLFDIDAETGVKSVVYDTAKQDIWPPDVEFGSLPWGEFPWDGRTPTTIAQRLPPLHFTRGMLSLGSASSITIGTGVKTLVTDGPTTGFTEGMPVAVSRQADWNYGFLGEVQSLVANQLVVRVTDIEGAGTFSDWMIRAVDPSSERQSYEARFAAVHLFNDGNASGYVQLGALFAGPYTQPTRNIANGFQVANLAQSQRTRARGGQLYVNRRRQIRRFDLTIPYLDRDEAFATFYELQRAKDLALPFIVMLDPGDTVNAVRFSIYATLADLPAIEHMVGRYHTVRLPLEEYV